jgi:hypothetical protein
LATLVSNEANRADRYLPAGLMRRTRRPHGADAPFRAGSCSKRPKRRPQPWAGHLGRSASGQIAVFTGTYVYMKDTEATNWATHPHELIWTSLAACFFSTALIAAAIDLSRRFRAWLRHGPVQEIAPRRRIEQIAPPHRRMEYRPMGKIVLSPALLVIIGFVFSELGHRPQGVTKGIHDGIAYEIVRDPKPRPRDAKPIAESEPGAKVSWKAYKTE